MNGIQRSVISLAVPIIIILIGFTVIGSSFSTFGGIGDNPSIVFDPLQYLFTAWNRMEHSGCVDQPVRDFLVERPEEQKQVVP